MIELAVAVVTMAGTLPIGFLLGRLYERERAELRRPPAAHEALALVYQMPIEREILGVLRGPLGKGPA